MRLSRNNLVACVGFALMSALGVYAAFRPKLLDPLAIIAHARSTSATLDDEYTERRSRAGTGYDVKYSFVVDGITYRGSSAIDEQPQATMAVWYLPSAPGVNGIDLRGRAWFDLGIFAVAALVLLLSVGALALHAMHRVDDERPPFVASVGEQPVPRRRRPPNR